jgi:hypothetical protein
MSPWPPSLVADVQVLVTYATSIAILARHLGNPPRPIRAPVVCALFHLPVGLPPRRARG